MVEDEGQVSWHMASLITLELSKLRAKANSEYQRTDFNSAMSTLESIRMTANYAFTQEERIDLDKLENEILPLLMKVKGIGSFNKASIKLAATTLEQVRPLLKTYNNKLLDALDKHGFFGARKKDAAKMLFTGMPESHKINLDD